MQAEWTVAMKKEEGKNEHVDQRDQPDWEKKGENDLADLDVV